MPSIPPLLAQRQPAGRPIAVTPLDGPDPMEEDVAPMDETDSPQMSAPAVKPPPRRSGMRLNQFTNPYVRAANADAIRQEDREDARTAQWQEQQAPQQQRVETDQAKEAQRQRNDALEARFRQEGRPFYTDSRGNLRPSQTDATWQSRKAEQEAKAAEEARQKTLRTELDTLKLDLETRRPLNKDERGKHEAAIQTHSATAQAALEASLSAAASAREPNPDWIPFNKQPTVSAQEAAAKLAKLQERQQKAAETGQPFTLDDEDLNLLPPDQAPTAQALREARQKLAEDDTIRTERQRLIERRRDLGLRLANPVEWEKRQKARLDSLPAADLMKEVEQRGAALQERDAALAEQSTRLQQQTATLDQEEQTVLAENEQRLASGIAATDIVTDGNGKTWHREIWDKLQDVSARRQQTAQEMEPLLREHHAAIAERNRDAALVSHAAQTAEQKRKALVQTSRQQLRAGGMAATADKLDALDATEAQRLAEVDAQHQPGTPEHAAARQAVSESLKQERRNALNEGRDRQRVLQQAGLELHTLKQQDRAAMGGAFSDTLTTAQKLDPNTVAVASKNTAAEVGRIAAAHGLQPEDVIRAAADAAKLDFESHKQPAVVLNDGSVAIHPERWFDDDASLKQAVEGTNATAEAKAAALDPQRIQALRENFVQGNLEALYNSAAFARWEKSAAGKKTEGMTEVPRAVEFLKTLGPADKLWEQIKTALYSYGLSIPQITTALLAPVSDTAAEAGSYLDNQLQLARQEDVATGAASFAKGIPGMLTEATLSLGPSLIGGRVLAVSRLALAGKGIEAGKAARMASQWGLAGAAGAGALQSYGGTYHEAVQSYLNQGMTGDQARQAAVLPALLSGLSTAVVTAGFGTKGTEAFFRNGGIDPAFRKSIGSYLKLFAKEGWSEAQEESLDQFIQGLAARSLHEPGKSMESIVQEAAIAGALGFVLGGAVGGTSDFLQRSREASASTTAAMAGANNSLEDWITPANAGSSAQQAPNGTPSTTGAPSPAGGSAEASVATSPQAGAAPDVGGAGSAEAGGGTSRVPSPAVSPEQVAAAEAQIADWQGEPGPDGAAPDPAMVQDQQRRATGAMKIAQGAQMTNLDESERNAVGYTLDSGKVKPIKGYAGPKVLVFAGENQSQPILTNAYRAELQAKLPAVGGLIKMDEQQAMQFFRGRQHATDLTTWLTESKGVPSATAKAQVDAFLQANPDAATGDYTDAKLAMTDWMAAQGTGQQGTEPEAKEVLGASVPPASMPSSTIPGWNEAAQTVLQSKAAADSPKATQALDTLGKEIERWSSAFEGGVDVLPVTAPAPDGGGVWVEGTRLKIHLPRFLQNHGTRANTKHIAAMVVEEVIHVLAQKKIPDMRIRELWLGLPQNLRQTVWTAYWRADITNKVKPEKVPDDLDEDGQWQMGHEFLRMLVQDSGFRGEVTESFESNPTLLKRILALLKRLAASLREGVNRLPGSQRKVIEAYEASIRKAIDELQGGTKPVGTPAQDDALDMSPPARVETAAAAPAPARAITRQAVAEDVEALVDDVEVVRSDAVLIAPTTLQASASEPNQPPRRRFMDRLMGRRGTEATRPQDTEQARAALDASMPPQPFTGQSLNRPPVALDFLPSGATVTHDRDQVWNSLAEAIAGGQTQPEAGRNDPGRGGSANAPLPRTELDPEAALVWQWAEKSGRVLDPAALERFTEGKPQFGKNEHLVYLDPESGRVVKITHSHQYGNKGLSAWIANAQKSNARWGDDIHLVGAVEAEPGNVQLVLSQPFIPEARPATRAEIDWHLYQKGYRRVSDLTYYHPDREEAVSDAQEENVLWSAQDRQAHAIDVHFFTPGESLKQMWDNVIAAAVYPVPTNPEARPSLQASASFVEPGFYSQLQTVVEAKMGRTMPAADLKAVLANPQNKIKAEEIKWSGVMQAIDRLASEHSGKVPKADLLEHLRTEGAVRFQEVRLGERGYDPEKARRQRLDELFDEARQDPQNKDISDYHLRRQVESSFDGAELDYEKTQATKFSQYQLPGGENYREVVLAMPETADARNQKRLHEEAVGDLAWAADRQGGNYTPEQLAPLQQRVRDLTPTIPDAFTSSHFGEVPHYVAHMRLNDRTDAEGRPGTFLEEIQSDRAQKWMAARNAYAESQWKGKKWAELTKDQQAEAIAHADKQIPDAPWLRDTGGWSMNLFKRALREAVDARKSWIGWTTGKTQVDRYSEALRQSVDRISWVEMPDEEGMRVKKEPLWAEQKAIAKKRLELERILTRTDSPVGSREEPSAARQAALDEYNALRRRNDVVTSALYELNLTAPSSKLIRAEKNGQVTFTGHVDESGTFLDGPGKGEKVEDVLGKEVAAKIAGDVAGDLRGDGLTVGGEGMKGFYDDILPKEIGKYVKQWGAKVEKSALSTDTRYTIQQDGRRWLVKHNGITVQMLNSEGEAKSYLTEVAGESSDDTPIWRVDLTPAMREGVKERGQPLFASASEPSMAVSSHARAAGIQFTGEPTAPPYEGAELAGTCVSEDQIRAFFGSLDTLDALIREKGDTFSHEGVTVTYNPRTHEHFFWVPSEVPQPDSPGPEGRILYARSDEATLEAETAASRSRTEAQDLLARKNTATRRAAAKLEREFPGMGGVLIYRNAGTLRLARDFAEMHLHPDDLNAIMTGRMAGFFVPSLQRAVILTDYISPRAGENLMSAGRRVIVHEMAHKGAALLRRHPGMQRRWEALTAAIRRDYGQELDGIAAERGYAHLKGNDSALADEWAARRLGGMSTAEIQALQPQSLLGRVWHHLKLLLRDALGLGTGQTPTVREVQDWLARTRDAVNPAIAPDTKRGPGLRERAKMALRKRREARAKAKLVAEERARQTKAQEAATAARREQAYRQALGMNAQGASHHDIHEATGFRVSAAHYGIGVDSRDWLSTGGWPIVWDDPGTGPGWKRDLHRARNMLLRGYGFADIYTETGWSPTTINGGTAMTMEFGEWTPPGERVDAQGGRVLSSSASTPYAEPSSAAPFAPAPAAQPFSFTGAIGQPKAGTGQDDLRARAQAEWDSAFKPNLDPATGRESMSAEDARAALESFMADPTDTDYWPADLRDALDEDPLYGDIAFSQEYPDSVESRPSVLPPALASQPKHQAWRKAFIAWNAGEETEENERLVDAANAWAQSDEALALAEGVKARFQAQAMERAQDAIRQLEARGWKWNAKEGLFEEDARPVLFASASTVTPAQDAAYLSAVQAGDMETARRMVDEAAKAAGYTTMWTGRKSPPPDLSKIFGTIWDRPTWLTNERRVAVRYARGSYDPRPTPTKWVKRFNVKLRNPFVFERSAEVWKYLDKHLADEAPFTPEEIPDNENAADSGEVRDALQRLGFDGVHYTGDDMTGEGDRHESFLAFDPSQIKSADPVTYDDNGNIIPLSQRFNPESSTLQASASNVDSRPETGQPGPMASDTGAAQQPEPSPGGLSEAEARSIADRVVWEFNFNGETAEENEAWESAPGFTAHDLMAEIQGSSLQDEAAVYDLLYDAAADIARQQVDKILTEQKNQEYEQFKRGLEKRRETQDRIESVLGVKFQGGGPSVYAWYNGLKLRISNHAQVSGGGFNMNSGERMGESDLQWVVTDEDAERYDVPSKAEIRSDVAQALRSRRLPSKKTAARSMPESPVKPSLADVLKRRQALLKDAEDKYARGVRAQTNSKINTPLQDTKAWNYLVDLEEAIHRAGGDPPKRARRTSTKNPTEYQVSSAAEAGALSDMAQWGSAETTQSPPPVNGNVATFQPFNGSTPPLQASASSPSLLARAGNNHLDRALSDGIARAVKAARASAPGQAVEKFIEHSYRHTAPGQMVKKFVDFAKSQAVPLSLLPREARGWMTDMNIAHAFTQVQSMDVIRAQSGKAKFSDLFYPAGYAEKPEMKHRLWVGMDTQNDSPAVAKAKWDALPPELQKTGAGLRKLLIEYGKKAVKAGILNHETYEGLVAGYVPHYYENDETKGGLIGFLKRFAIGLKDIRQQRTTAWHILDMESAPDPDTKLHRAVTWDDKGRKWRFHSREHRDAFMHELVGKETLKALERPSMSPLRTMLVPLGAADRAEVLTELKALDMAGLDRLETLHPETRRIVREVMRQQSVRFRAERPLSLKEKEDAGLVADPAYAVARYIAQMGHDIGVAALFNHIAANPDYVANTASAGYTAIPESSRFGRLSGKFVKDEIAQQIVELIQTPDTAIKLYDSVLTAWKEGKTVWNPGTHVRNVLGNVMFAQFAGLNPFNPGNMTYYREALRTLRQGGDTLREMYEQGVLGADFSAAELKGRLNALLPDPDTIVDDDPSALTRIGRSVWQMMSRPAMKLREGLHALYGLEDSVYKAAAYLKQKHLGQSPAEAAAHVRKWFPYYDDIGRSATLSAARRTVMPFLSFYRESLRIFAQAAMERPLAMATGLAIPAVITAISAAILGLDDDDLEEIKKDMRGKGKFFLQDTPLMSILLPKKSASGQYQQWDLSNVIPFADHLARRMEDATPMPFWQYLANAALTGGPIIGTIYELAKGKDSFGNRNIWEEDMTPGEKRAAAAKHVWSNWAPPILPGGTAFQTIAQAGTRTTNKTLEKRDTTQAVLRAVGGLDWRNANPNLYRLAEDFRAKNNLPREPAFDGGTTGVQRARQRLFAALAQDNPDTAEIGKILGYLRDQGHPFETDQDINLLLFFRNPTMILKGKENQQRFVAGLRGIARTQMQQAQGEFAKIQTKAPGTIASAKALIPPKLPR